MGWAFALVCYEDERPKSWLEWLFFLGRPGVTIHDEYGQSISLDDFVKIVTARVRADGKPLCRSEPDGWCRNSGAGGNVGRNEAGLLVNRLVREMIARYRASQWQRAGHKPLTLRLTFASIGSYLEFDSEGGDVGAIRPGGVRVSVDGRFDRHGSNQRGFDCGAVAEMIMHQTRRKRGWEPGDKLLVVSPERAMEIDRQWELSLLLGSLDVIWRGNYSKSVSRYHVFSDDLWGIASIVGALR